MLWRRGSSRARIGRTGLAGPAICDWANAVFESLLPSEATAQQPAFERLDAAELDRPAGALGPIRLQLSDKIDQKRVPTEDATAIAAWIRSEVESRRRNWGDFMILTRKRTGRLAPYIEALESARVPYEVSGSGGLLESEFVQALISILYAVTHLDDGIALAGVLRGACFGFSDPELYAYRKAGGVYLLSVPPIENAGPVAGALRTLREWQNRARRLPAGAAVETILEESGLLAKAAASSTGGGEAAKLISALDRLRSDCKSGMTLGEAVTVLEECGETDESDSPVLEPGRHDVVRVMNLHQAKGLEAKVVLLADPLGGVKPRADLHIVFLH